MFCYRDHDRWDADNSRDTEFLDAIKEEKKFELREDIYWDLADYRQDPEEGLTKCVVHGKDAEPTGGLGGCGGILTQVSRLSAISDKVVVSYFDTFWHSGGAGRAVQRKLISSQYLPIIKAIHG